MKKIVSKKIREKRKTRNKTIVGLVLVALMLFSTAGYAFFSSPQKETKKIEYNNVNFILNENGFWQFEFQNKLFYTQHNPKETENISVPILKTLNNYKEMPLYFLNGEGGKQEIMRNFQGFVSKMQDACVEDYEKKCEDENLPLKNCSQHNIIIFEESEITEIKEEKNCVILFSPYNEQERVSDAFIFKILGIKGF